MIDVFWHPAVLDHDTGRGLFEGGPSPLLEVPELHPENAERVRNMVSVLQRGPLADRLRWHDGRLADADELTAVHTPAYIAMLRDACEQGGRVFAPSTLVTGESWQPLLAAAGTAMAAGDAVISGGSRIAYALVRPPGHHAAPAMADGYCFFNHVALVAERALAAGCERVAIIDWDVHHGNGTQEAFWTDPSVLTISLHQEDLFPPGSGLVTESGADAGTGANINLPLPAGAGRAAYLAALDRLMAAAASVCDGRIVACHEGGYSTAYVPYCGLAIIEVLAGVTSEVVDPWLTDARRVREIPLRTHEREAIDEAAALHGL